MTDHALAARLRELLSDEMLAQLETDSAKAADEATWAELQKPVGLRSTDLDAYGDKVRFQAQRDRLLPLLLSLQEEQRREIRELLEGNLASLRATYRQGDVYSIGARDALELALHSLASSSSASARREQE